MSEEVHVVRKDDPRVSNGERERYSERWFVFEGTGLLDVFKTRRDAEYFASTWRILQKVRATISEKAKASVAQLTKRFKEWVTVAASELEKQVDLPKLSRKQKKQFEEISGGLRQLVTLEILWEIRDSGWEDEQEESVTGS